MSENTPAEPVECPGLSGAGRKLDRCCPLAHCRGKRCGKSLVNRKQMPGIDATFSDAPSASRPPNLDAIVRRWTTWEIGREKPVPGRNLTFNVRGLATCRA